MKARTRQHSWLSWHFHYMQRSFNFLYFLYGHFVSHAFFTMRQFADVISRRICRCYIVSTVLVSCLLFLPPFLKLFFINLSWIIKKWFWLRNWFFKIFMFTPIMMIMNRKAGDDVSITDNDRNYILLSALMIIITEICKAPSLHWTNIIIITHIMTINIV